MLDIAVGTRRNTRLWKNKKMSWEDLRDKLSETHRTAETHKEYMAADKDRQDEIKDVGGFVGGYLSGGLRNATSVLHRQVLALDIDFGEPSFWEEFQMFYDNEGLIYSTHKHSPGKPRLRLIIPLDRPVTGEEYEAIGRRVAGNLGIDMFDPTTFQPFRFMHWPSTAADAEYLFEAQAGDWLCADEVLASYVNWADISAWPICSSENKKVRTDLKKQETPTDKVSWIGAFCRAYTIGAAIEMFIPDEYEEAIDGRYTYTGGSTAGGAVVYDDMFLYSHHSTDPCSGLLVNAFDLIRLHKFGHLDKNKDEDVVVTKLKSYGEMINLINHRSEVIREIGEFSALPNGEWVDKLEIKKSGLVAPTIDNIKVILGNDENLKNMFAYNAFEYRAFINGAVPWNPNEGERYHSDEDDAGLRHYLEKTFKLHQVAKTKDALDITASQNSFHPVREYLAKLKWDGVPRLETMFVEHLGAADTPYIRAATKKAITACVARVMQPGIKFDYVLTLVGPQGLGKSTILKELGGAWYSDSMGNIQGKEAAEQIQGVWVMEIGELAGLKKAEVEVIKHFITKQTDRFRVAYGHRVAEFPRQCVFFGTTNEVGFLRDPTGNRRFWPVSVYKKYEHGSANVAQIWAEAKALYESGEHLYLNEQLETDAMEVQRSHAEVDERSGVVEYYLNTPITEDWSKLQIYERRSFLSGDGFDSVVPVTKVERQQVCIAEIWCEALKCDFKDMTTFNTKPLHSIMQNMPGWERAPNKKYSIYGYQRSYQRIEADGSETRATAKEDFKEVYA